MKKLYLQCLLNPHMKQENTLYEHHQGAVIVILLDISDYNVLIAIVISFNIEMHFGVQNRPMF